VDEELKGTKHGYPEALSEGNLEEADIIGDIHKRSGEALWLLRIDYEVPVRATTLPTRLPLLQLYLWFNTCSLACLLRV
jgi:hypothetical protein